MPEPTPEAWAQIRHDYEHTDKPLAHICAEHDITIPMMRYRMKRWEWTRRKPLIPRHGPPPVERAVFSPPPVRAANGGEGSGVGGEAAIPPTASGENPPHPISSPCSEIDLSPQAGRGDEPVAIVPRLQAAAARILPAIEVAVARLASGELNSRDLEKTGRTLATLTRTLRELNALLVQHDAPLQPEDNPLDIDEFRNELARRIRAFVATEQSGHGAPGDQAAGPQGPGEYLLAATVDGPARA
jgi:hypothetical protein